MDVTPSISSTVPRADGRPWGHTTLLGALGRSGLVARGVVYGVVGLLSLKLALGAGGRTTSQQGAIRTIAHEPFGSVLLLALTIGLAGYAGWRLQRAWLGHGTQERDSGFARIAGVVSGVAYAGLCVTAASMLAGASGAPGGSPKREAAGVMSWSGGPELVGIAGAVLAGVGLYQGYKGLARKFLETSNTLDMRPQTKRIFTTIGIAGHLARMVVFVMIGYGLLRAAVEFRPHQAIGLDGALNKLTRAPDGPIMLGTVAAGLTCFALYSIVDARYRKV